MIAAVLAAAVLAPGSLPATWKHWKYVRSIQVRHTGSVAFEVPATIYANAQPTLSDLRIVDARGREVPFAIVTPPDSQGSTWIDATVTDRGFVPSRYSQAVADVGKHRAPYGVLDIVTPLNAFATRVDVDASDDGLTWRTIRTNAPIYDYERDGLATNTQVTFPESTARYVRVRVLSRKRPFPILGLRFAAPSAPAAEARYQVRLGARARNAEGTTSYRLFGIDSVPIDRLRIDAASLPYARTVDIESSDEGRAWQTVSSGTIARTHDTYRAFIDFTETQAPDWRIRIHDGSDAPLRAVTVTAYGLPRRVVFDARTAMHYRLIYGNLAASAPQFDYAATHTNAPNVPADATLSAPTRNPGFVSLHTQPWSERHPWLLWVALAIAVAGIGIIAIRTMSGGERTIEDERNS